MITPAPTSTIKLAAIDLDGTLLGPDLTISSENLHALKLLRGQGTEIVVVTGRHYLSLQPFLKFLPDVRWVVSVQGAEVSDHERKQILHRSYLRPNQVAEALSQAKRERLDYLVYTHDGIATDCAESESQAFYRNLSGLTPRRLAAEALRESPIFKVLWLGEADSIARAATDQQIGSTSQKVRTHARILEFLPSGDSKGTGLQVLADHLGITAAQCATFGDAENDIPMFNWSGFSVAMPDGWPAARAAAKMIAPSGSPATALARGVEALLASIGSTQRTVSDPATAVARHNFFVAVSR